MGFSVKAQIKHLWLRLRYGTGPQSVPKRLDAATLGAALEAARFLSAQGVDVRSLAQGEEASQPKPAGEAPPGYPAPVDGTSEG